MDTLREMREQKKHKLQEYKARLRYNFILKAKLEQEKENYQKNKNENIFLQVLVSQIKY